MNSVAIAAALALLCLCAPASAEGITVTKNGSQPVVKSPAENFTGKVHTTNRFNGTAPSRLVGSTVVFEPGARTAWHTHPLGQTLIVTEGTGLVGLWKGDVQIISKGDVVWIPAGVKHWHGASGDEGVTHIAIVETLDSKAADWMEHVTDEQYAVR